MSVGLIINDVNGVNILNMTMFISQSLGYVDTNGGPGSVTIPEPPAGRNLFFSVVPLVDLQVEKGKKPGVSLSGTTLSWNYSYNTNGWGFFSANCRIYYGYY